MSFPHECKVCFQRFENRTQVAKHMYLHNQGHICSQCNKPFASESGLKRHINANHTQQRSVFKCTICDLTFRLKRDFEKHHLSKHRADKHFECKQCGAKFSWLINLKKHEKFHTDQKDNSDSINDSFNDPTREDASVTKLYQCEICGKKFNYDFTYAIHLAGHEKSKSHNTTTTDVLNDSETVAETSVDNTEVSAEMVDEVESGNSVQVADGDKSKVLNYIPSEEENKDLFEYLSDCRNRREGKLKRKRKDEVIYDFVMTEDKPFKCTQCSEAFRWQVSLDIHLKVHSGVKTLKVRKPYLSSKMVIAEKMKKKGKSEKVGKKDDDDDDEGGGQNVSKIIYQNESDEDNDIYDEEEDEENKGNEVKEQKLAQNVDKNTKENTHASNSATITEASFSNGKSNKTGMVVKEEKEEEGMGALELLNSINNSL